MKQDSTNYLKKLISSGTRMNKFDLLVKEIFEELDLKRSYMDMTPIYDICNSLGINIVTTDYKVGGDVAQFISRKDKRPYISVDYTTNCRRVRFNIATMLYCALLDNNNTNYVVTKIPDNKKLHNAKKFASCLLLPRNHLKSVLFEKNDIGNYKYLIKQNDNYVIPFSYIHYIAERFGVEFSVCAKRIFYSNLVKIDGVDNIYTLRSKLLEPEASESARKKYIDFYDEHDFVLLKYLINNLYFPKITKISEEICEKLRRETVKNDSIIEGVVSSARGIEKFLNKYKSNQLQELFKLSISQRIMIGHYETIKELENIPFNKYFFNELHSRLFKYAQTSPEEIEWLENPQNCNRSGKDDFIDFIPGQFRKTQNAIMRARFETDSIEDIYFNMNNLYYDAKYLLDNKDNYNNYDYINKVNNLVHRFCVCHPFEDGNGRVARLFMNYMFVKKGLPPVYINASNQRKSYINALICLSDACRRKLCEQIDYRKLNLIIMKCMLETECLFYPKKKMLSQPIEYIEDQKRNEEIYERTHNL